MEKIMSKREKEEGRLIQDLLATMTDNEKELFQAYLKGAQFITQLREAK
jgi:hypothetical protein